MIKHITQFEILIFIICTEIFEGGGEGGQLKKNTPPPPFSLVLNISAHTLKEALHKIAAMQ